MCLPSSAEVIYPVAPKAVVSALELSRDPTKLMMCIIMWCLGGGGTLHELLQ